MFTLLEQAEKLAELENTEVLSHRVSEDGTAITFVVAAGPKRTMTAEQLRAALREMEPSEPFDYIEQVVAKEQVKETSAEKKARLKAEHDAKKKAGAK